MKYQITLLLFFLASLALGQEKTTIFSGVNIIDAESGTIKNNQHVVIQKGMIQAIESKIGKKYSDAEIIPVEGKWMIPGLIDAHVHFFQSGGLYTRPDVIDLRKLVPYEEEQQRVWEQKEDFMKRYLSVGITDVCDVGGPMTNYQVRDFADSTDVSPHVYITGPLISSYQPEEFQIDDSPIIKVNSPEEARQLVRKQVPLRPDFIKIWFIVLRGQKPQMHMPIIEATIDESQKHGIPVAVHATQLETARLAVKAGAKILVHSVDDKEVDQEFIDLLKEKEVSYIPTMVVSDNYEKVLSQNLDFSLSEQEVANPFILGSLMDLQHIDPAYIPRWVKSLMETPYSPLSKISVMQKNLQKIADAGVNIVTGTDAGNIGTLHASSYQTEILAMQKAGLSNRQILQASTINGAKMLGRIKQTGSIEVGKMADFVIIQNNPLENIGSIFNIDKVIKGGVIYEPGELMAASPEEIVQRQLNAYNLGDIDAFMETYHRDIHIYNFPDQPLFQDWEIVRQRYAELFAN
ncbi:MAG: amidohydrolase family protein, partial [Bacteroidetes bacterium]|nr:amidohydrolase family protein [Bacteroidota bacterium]